MTLRGSGFQTGATVTFGGTAATIVIVTSSTLMTAIAPANPAGLADVVVANPDGRKSGLSGYYTYFENTVDACGGYWNYVRQR